MLKDITQVSGNVLENNSPPPANPIAITAELNDQWHITQQNGNLFSAPADRERDPVAIEQHLAESLSVFNAILGPFPYASFTFRDPTRASNGSTPAFTQVHLARPNGDPTEISVHIVPSAENGARYSDISTRVFGNANADQYLTNGESVGDHITMDHAREFMRYAERCQRVAQRFQTGDVILHNNPQGVQEFVNQPLGGFKDTGGQNKYVESFARALGSTVIAGKEEAPCQIILNRGGLSQKEILEQSIPKQEGGDPAVRNGVHFFPDDNVCLAFVQDTKPKDFTVKEQSHPHWARVTSDMTIAADADVVSVRGGRLREFGIADGMYVMTDPGPMKELAEASKDLLNYFKFEGTERQANDEKRQIVMANHYVDAAYLGEFMWRGMPSAEMKSFFFIHSLGTYKADGLDFPEMLKNEAGKAQRLENELRLKDRILGELWVVQNCEPKLIANSEKIAYHAHRYLGASGQPQTMIAIDDAANHHVKREDRRALSLEVFEKLYSFYQETCDNPIFGEPVPQEKRLSLDRLLDAQIISERSRHAEANSKGKASVVKAMAIAQSDPLAQDSAAPDRVLVVNINYPALHGNNQELAREIETIIQDVKSIRASGGHVIIQPSFDYKLGLQICKISDCYMSLPSFEPFGMAVLEAAAAGARIIARADVPAVKEILSDKVSWIKFPLVINDSVEIGIAEGAILVGYPEETPNVNGQAYTEAAYTGAAAAINAITLGIQPFTPGLKFDPSDLGDNATNLVMGSKYNWSKNAQRFLRDIYNGTTRHS